MSYTKGLFVLPFFLFCASSVAMQDNPRFSCPEYTGSFVDSIDNCLSYRYPQYVSSMVDLIEKKMIPVLLLSNPISRDYAVGPLDVLATKQENVDLMERIVTLFNIHNLHYRYELALYYAVSFNNKPAVTLLLKQKAKPSFSCINALIESVTSDHLAKNHFSPEKIADILDIARMLIAHGAPINGCDFNGSTALYKLTDSLLKKRRSLLMAYQHKTMVQKLFSFISKKDSAQLTLHRKLIALCMRAGANPYYQPHSLSETAATCASKDGYSKLINYFNEQPKKYHAALVSILSSRSNNTTEAHGWQPLPVEIAWMIADMVYPHAYMIPEKKEEPKLFFFN